MILTYSIAGIMMRTATELTFEQHLIQQLIQLSFYVMLFESFHLHISARLSLDGFPCNLLFGDFYENRFKKSESG
jgi:hypothetical protein